MTRRTPTPIDPEVFEAELQDRLAQRGVKPCRCGESCSAYRYVAGKVRAGLVSAENGTQSAAGVASAARLGSFKDGRSRAASVAARARWNQTEGRI